MNDAEELLEVQGPNCRSDYRMKFTSPQDVLAMTDWIKSFVDQSIENETAGRKVELSTHLDYHRELLEHFSSDLELKGAFGLLKSGRQRGYILYFSQAKQSTTRARRIAKYRSRIIVGKGILDR